MARHDGKNWVLFRDGTSGRYTVFLYEGACLSGQPTAYIYRGDEFVWVRPGGPFEFVEAN